MIRFIRLSPTLLEVMIKRNDERLAAVSPHLHIQQGDLHVANS